MTDFLNMAKDRYSVRKFKSTPVEDEKIAAILEAARLAPTACNYQPQKIYAVKSAEKLAALKKISTCTFDAPLVFVVGYDEERSAKGLIHETYDFGDIDASIVCTHMMLEAHELGLGSCWVGYFKESDAKAALGLPENVHVRAFLPVGYPADGVKPAHLHAKSRSIEDIAEIM